MPNRLRILRVVSSLKPIVRSPAKELTDDGLAIALNSAKLLRDVCTITPFPYISSAAYGLVVIIECIQRVRSNKDAYIDLVDRIRLLLELLGEQIREGPQDLDPRLEAIYSEFCKSLEEIVIKIQDRRNQERGYLVQLLKSSSIRETIDRFNNQFEDMKSNLLVTTTLDIRREVKLGIAKLNDGNEHVLSAISALKPTSVIMATGDIDAYDEELQTILLRDWVSTGLPRISKPNPWINSRSDALVYEQPAKLLAGDISCTVRTFKGNSKRQKQAAFELWRKEKEFFSQCRVSFLPQLFGVSRSASGLSLFFHSDDTSDIPVGDYFKRLDNFTRIIFRIKYTEALVGAHSFMRVNMERSLVILDSPWEDYVNTVGSGSCIKVLNWRQRAERSIDIGQPSPLLQGIADLNLDSCLLALKSLDRRQLIMGVMTKETFGVCGSFSRVSEQGSVTGLGDIHCTCCCWDLPSSSRRVSRSRSPALLSSWIGITPDYATLSSIFGSENGQKRHNVFLHHPHNSIQLREFKAPLRVGKQVICCEVHCRSDHQMHHSYLSIPRKNHEDYFFLNLYRWTVEINYQPFGYDLSNTFLSEEPGSLASPAEPPQCFVSVVLSLTANNIPMVEVTISPRRDFRSIFSPSQLAARGINIQNNDPVIGISYPRFYLAEVMELCHHLDIDIQEDLLPWLDDEFGIPVFHPEPTLSKGWKWGINHQGVSYFTNPRKGVTRFIPPHSEH